MFYKRLERYRPEMYPKGVIDFAYKCQFTKNDDKEKVIYEVYKPSLVSKANAKLIRCTAIGPRIRKAFYEHFVISKHDYDTEIHKQNRLRGQVKLVRAMIADDIETDDDMNDIVMDYSDPHVQEKPTEEIFDEF